MDYLVHLLILICIYVILAQSFNLVFGLGGLFNLAHVAVYAIGAYTTALMSTELQSGFFLCLVCSFFLAGLLGLVIGVIALRLSHDYFAIGSLAFSAVVTALLINWKELTRGVLGIPGIPRPELAQVDFAQITNFFYLSAVVAALSLAALYLIFRSSYGRALRAQALGEQGVAALGRNTRMLKICGFFLASCFAGLGGSLFAYYLNYIDPSSFSLSEMVLILTIVVVGRPGSFWGMLVSTVFLVVVLPEGLRCHLVPALDPYSPSSGGDVGIIALAGDFFSRLHFEQINPSILGPMRQLLHGLILFVVVYMNRRRLFPVQRLV